MFKLKNINKKKKPAIFSHLGVNSPEWLVDMLFWIQRLIENFCLISGRRPERGRKIKKKKKKKKKEEIKGRQ